MGGELDFAIVMTARDLVSPIVSKIAGALGPVGELAVASATAIAGIGVESIKMAGDFQQSVLSLVAHAGLAKNQVGAISQAVLDMAPEVGRVPTELSEALYPILSSFSDISNASAKSALSLQTLKLSFETVAGTTTDGTAVANTAVSVFHALGLATNDAALNASRMTGLFDLMDKSVQDGNMSWDAYRGTIGKVALATQGTNISFTEANAALDVLTASGFPSARQAGTSLSNLLTEMVIKQDTVATKAEKLGLAFDGQAYNAMTLSQRIAYLNEVTGGNQAELLKMLSGSTAAEKAFNALSANTGKYAANLQDLKKSQGALANSFDVAKQGFNFQLQQAGAFVSSLEIKLGTVLLPTVQKLFGWVSSNVFPIMDELVGAFVSVLSPVQQVAAALNPATLAVADSAAFMGTLTDAFDRHGNAITDVGKRTLFASDAYDRHSVSIDNQNTKVQDITDAYDRQSHQIHATVQNTNPLIDAYDRHTQSLSDVGQKTKAAATSVNPFVDVMKKLGDYMKSTGEPILHLFADDLGKNLLPPVLSLIGDTATLVANFTSWLNTSGVLKDALDTVTGLLGTLVGWVDDFVKGLQDGNPWAIAIAVSLGLVATALASIKVLEFTAGIANMFTKLQEGDGVISNLADKLLSKFLPNIKKAFFDKGSLQDTAATSQTAMQDLSENIDTLSVSIQELTDKIATLGPATDSATTQAQADIDALIASFDTATVQAQADIDALIASFDEVDTSIAGTGTAIASIGTEATTAEGVVEGAATGMSGAWGLAFGGMSLLVGGVIGAVKGLGETVSKETDGITQMSTQTKQAYDDLGTSTADNAAKMQAKQVETALVSQNAADKSRGAWDNSTYQSAQAMDDATAKMILDQQKVADAAQKAAQDTENRWQEWFDGMTAMGYNPNPGGPSVTPGYTGRGTVSPGSILGHASGGTIGAGSYGFVAESGTGGELVYSNPGGGTTVYTGAQSRQMMGGGGGHTFNINVDARGNPDGGSIATLIRSEIADLMRSRTVLPNISSGGRL